MRTGFKKTFAGVTVLAAVLMLLAGCIAQTAPETTQTPAATASPTQPASPTPTPAATATPTTAPDVTAADDSAQKALLHDIRTAAQTGHIINCDYALKSDIVAIEDAWGAPDTSEYVQAAKGTYALYEARDVAFGFNKGAQVFEVRSFDDRLGQLRFSAVTAEFGDPPYHVTTASEEIIGYYAGTEYKLLLVFPRIEGGNTNPALTHYSVFYPDGTVNMMADDPGREW